MAVPRLRVPSGLPGGSLRQAAGLVSDEVELYHRTYTTLLRSSGETLLRVLEPSHRSMNSSLHPLASTNEVDLGAFMYAMRRLPAGVWQTAVIVMGQEAQVFERAGVGRIEDWEPVEAPARRRRWFDSHEGTMAALLASTSDLDDVIPTLVAYQVEWNKLNAVLRATDRPPGDELDPAACAEAYGGNEDDWIRIREAWGDLSTFLDEVRGRKLNLRIRMLGGSQAGYARMTRRWWRPVRSAMEEQGLGERPVYFVSSNPHSMVNLVTPTARSGEAEIVRFIEEHGPEYLREELERFREGRAEGSWENFLYFGARLLWESLPEDGEQWRRRKEAERALGVTHISSKAALRVSSQIMALDRLDPAGLDPRLGPVDAEALARSNAVVVNVEYPLGLAAYNILRELTVSTDVVRGVVRARQGGDPECRRRRRADLRRHPRRALGLDLLARQRVLVRRHRAVPALRLGARQPARGDGQEHVPAEPRVPRLLLPRGVHGGRDGGRAVLQRGLRDGRRRSLPGGRGGQLLQAPDRLRDHPLRL